MNYRLFAILLWAVVMVRPAVAQQVVSGRVLAGSEPVANQLVSLHHVTDDGGSTLATDSTDAAGRFEFTVADMPSQGIFFAATRFEGQLYIGEPFRRSEQPADYLVAVGPGATPIELGGAGAAPQTAPAPSPYDTRAGLVVVLIAVALFGSVAFFMMRRSTPPQRRVLLEIAELDERNAARPVRDYEKRRTLLLERLRETV